VLYLHGLSTGDFEPALRDQHLDGGPLFECRDRDLRLLETGLLMLEQIAAQPPGRRPVVDVGLPLGDQIEDPERVSEGDVKLSRGRPHLGKGS